MVKLDLQCCFLHVWFYQQWPFSHFQTLSRGLTIFGEKSLFFFFIYVMDNISVEYKDCVL